MERAKIEEEGKMRAARENEDASRRFMRRDDSEDKKLFNDYIH